jgi:hypothetical protein
MIHKPRVAGVQSRRRRAATTSVPGKSSQSIPRRANVNGTQAASQNRRRAIRLGIRNQFWNAGQATIPGSPIKTGGRAELMPQTGCTECGGYETTPGRGWNGCGVCGYGGSAIGRTWVGHPPCGGDGATRGRGWNGCTACGGSGGQRGRSWNGCTNCGGSGGDLGKGYTEELIPSLYDGCRYCGGSGHGTWNDVTKGSGRIPCTANCAAGRIGCVDCGGKGESPCPHCTNSLSGAGKIYCNPCHGTGWLERS